MYHQIKAIPGAHWVHMEYPDRVNTIIWDWLCRISQNNGKIRNTDMAAKRDETVGGAMYTEADADKVASHDEL